VKPVDDTAACTLATMRDATPKDRERYILPTETPDRGLW
jgi:hypothetical protein